MKRKAAYDVAVGDCIALPAALMCDEVVVKSMKVVQGPQGKMVFMGVEANTDAWKGTAEFAFPGNFNVNYYPPAQKGIIRRFFSGLFKFVFPFGQD